MRLFKEEEALALSVYWLQLRIRWAIRTVESKIADLDMSFEIRAAVRRAKA